MVSQPLAFCSLDTGKCFKKNGSECWGHLSKGHFTPIPSSPDCLSNTDLQLLSFWPHENAESLFLLLSCCYNRVKSYWLKVSDWDVSRLDFTLRKALFFSNVFVLLQFLLQGSKLDSCLYQSPQLPWALISVSVPLTLKAVNNCI